MAALSGAAFVVLVVAANNFYWGASQTAGGDYYLFNRALPRPFGPLLWAAIKPLLLATPVSTALATYLAVKSRRNPHAPRICRRCGYDLTGNVSGVCPECGGAARARGE